MMGQILLIAVAVAVTALTAGAAVAALGPATGIISGLTAIGAGTTGLTAAAVAGIGAVAGAVGSLASQGVGIATGLQSSFNWKGVGLAAIAGGIGAGMGPSGFFGTNGAFGGVGNGVVAGALRGAVGSALTQGIGVATGLQDKFSWSGVAGAALGGGISGAIGNRFSALGSFGGNLASNAVGGIANAAARSLIDGTDFGDNLIAALPDVIGSTLGNWLVDGIAGGASAEATGADEAYPGASAYDGDGIDDIYEEDGDTHLNQVFAELAADLRDAAEPIQLASIGDLQEMGPIFRRNGIGHVRDLNTEFDFGDPSTITRHLTGLRAGQTKLLRDGDMLMTLIGPNSELVPIDITSDFTSDTRLASRILDLDAVIVGQQYGLVGLIPSIPPVELSPEIGITTLRGRTISGSSSPDHYYVASWGTGDNTGFLTFGRGDPPVSNGNARPISGFGGGLGLLLNGRRIPINSATYAGDRRYTAGISIFAYDSRRNIVGIFTRPEGANTGTTLAETQTFLQRAGFDNAVLFDSGSSTSLVYQGRVVVSPDWRKNISIPMAIGIRPVQPPNPPFGRPRR